MTTIGRRPLLRRFVLGAAGLLAPSLPAAAAAQDSLRGTGDLGVVVERSQGRLLLVEHSTGTALARVGGLGDLSHATVVFSRDARFAYVFGRDGGLSQVDLLTASLRRRVIQAGNSIGGAISEDGRIVAVANYEPGGVRFFAADTLEPLGEIPALVKDTRSRVVGLEDAPGNRFIFSLYEAGEIWLADLGNDPANPEITRFPAIGRQPYDALITANGRAYIAGLFGEDGLVLLDLWQENPVPQRILNGYGRGRQPLPVYKMPHLESWGCTEGLIWLPAIGHSTVLVADSRTWQEVGQIAVLGQPVFVMARPDGRQIWVNFALPNNHMLQVIDVPSRRVVATLTPGPGVLHMEFTPRGEQVWVSVRDHDRIRIYSTRTLALVGEIPADKPSGIFFTARAGRIGL